MAMDQRLYQAATTGEMALFYRCLVTHSVSIDELERYFLSQTSDTKENIIHVAVNNSHEHFIGEVIGNLEQHSSLIVELICQEDSHGYNPLHNAARKGNLNIVQLLINSYKKSSENILPEGSSSSYEIRVAVENKKQPPWTKEAHRGETPLNMAIVKGHGEVAEYILSQDMEILCKMEDSDGKSPLYLAVENGVESVALSILNNVYPYSPGHLPNCQMLLHAASHITSNVALLVLEKHPEVLTAKDTNGDSFLHELAFRGEMESIQCLIEDPVFLKWGANYRNLLREENNFGCNPIHRGVYSDQVKLLILLIDKYNLQPVRAEEANIEFPWLRRDHNGDTPLDLAIRAGLEDVALYFLGLESVITSLSDINGTNPLFLAVEFGCVDVARRILEAGGSSQLLLTGPVGQNPFHVASKCRGMAQLLINHLDKDLLFMKDARGKAPLDYAARAGNIELMQVIIESSDVTSAQHAWIGACEEGHMEALKMFMNNCNDFKKLCLDQQDTPLHHIELASKEEYQELLDIPLILQQKNALDNKGATPLHRAIERRDIILVELLLGIDGIDWNIKDNNGKTAQNLLAKLCEELPVWDAMCKLNHINPRIETTYIPLIKAKMPEIRTSLSVVAALFATITFAAGFTIPGGYNDDGNVILARKAAFIVFLLTDTYAMCCSMLVLFCLIWAMVCEEDESLILVDHSIFILRQALYGTLVAFMTGIYTVVSHDSLWIAIVVCVMCSAFGIATKKSVLNKIMALMTRARKLSLSCSSINRILKLIWSKNWIRFLLYLVITTIFSVAGLFVSDVLKHR